MGARPATIRVNIVTFAALALILMTGVFGPSLAPYSPMYAENGAELRSPSIAHPLGTDSLGRDVWSRWLTGGQNTLIVAALATAIACLPGIALGLFAGYRGGWPDQAGLALANALLAFPGLLGALIVVTALGSGRTQIAIAVGISNIAPVFVVTRGATRQVTIQPYIESARSLGVGAFGLITRQIWPNVAPTAIAFAGVVFGWALISGASLGFLGFAGDPGVPEWGAMIADGRAYLRLQPYVAVSAGAALTTVTWLITALTARRQRQP